MSFGNLFSNAINSPIFINSPPSKTNYKLQSPQTETLPTGSLCELLEKGPGFSLSWGSLSSLGPHMPRAGELVSAAGSLPSGSPAVWAAACFPEAPVPGCQALGLAGKDNRMAVWAPPPCCVQAQLCALLILP